MIGVSYDGWHPAGLIRYLFGPGRAEDHHRPRVVAAWNGAPGALQPSKSRPGEFDFELGALIAHMQHGVRAAGLPLSNPRPLTAEWVEYLRSGRQLPRTAPERARHYRYDRNADAVVLREGYVWHTPIRLAPNDPVLSDTQWEHIARRIMTKVGIQDAGCRWVAVRHADDHIHLMAVLVRRNRRGEPARFHPKFWKARLREACRELEEELELTPTAAWDGTAARTPQKAELEKAHRTGTEPTRIQLRRIVSQIASTSRTPEEFQHALADHGIAIRWARTAAGAVRGYAVALAGSATARTVTGTPVFYSGGSLAADLTWPKLLARWATAPEPAPIDRTADGRASLAGRGEVLAQTERIVTRATEDLRTGRADGDGVAHATGELLAALARVAEGPQYGPLTAAADVYDRAARTPRLIVPDSLSGVAFELRQAARRLGRLGVVTGRGREKVAVAALILALAGLIAEIASWHLDHGRLHQSAAAHRARRTLPVATRPGVEPPASRPARQTTGKPARPVRWHPVAPQQEPVRRHR